MIASKRAHLSIREADICDGETPQTEVGLFFFFLIKDTFPAFQTFLTSPSSPIICIF